jgi:hypothetical protein
MDILVMLDEITEESAVLAHVNSVPSPLDSELPSREVVTLYGTPDHEALALALAAAVECRRVRVGGDTAIRHLGVWPERGAIGDAAWRDAGTGQLMTRDLEISLDALHATARLLLLECGPLIGRVRAGLSMPDWPEGTQRAISVSLSGSTFGLGVQHGSPFENILDRLREADGVAFEYDSE